MNDFFSQFPIKIALTMFFLSQAVFSIAQQIQFEGWIIDKSSNDSLPFSNVQLINHFDTLNTSTDINGKFSFINLQKGIYKIKISSLAYEEIDTIINIGSSIKTSFFLSRKTIIYSSSINKTGALEDIKNQRITLFLPGGFAGPPTFSNDSIFEKKYKITFQSIGCVRIIGDNFSEYNQTIFKYLDKEFGKIWRKEIRKDVIGL